MGPLISEALTQCKVVDLRLFSYFSFSLPSSLFIPLLPTFPFYFHLQIQLVCPIITLKKASQLQCMLTATLPS